MFSRSASSRTSSRPKAVTITTAGCLRMAGVALDEARGLQPVHAGHLPVHEDDVVGRAGVVLLHRGHRLRASAHRVHLRHHARQRVGEDVARGRVVVDDQRAQAVMSWAGTTRPAAEPSPNQAVKMKVLPSPGVALQPDLPAHQLHQPARDGEAEAGASVLAGGGHVRLREGLEQLGHLLRASCRCRCPGPRSAAWPCRPVRSRSSAWTPDLALGGELDRVVDEVGQDLAQAQRDRPPGSGGSRRGRPPGTPAPSRAPSAR